MAERRSAATCWATTHPHFSLLPGSPAYGGLAAALVTRLARTSTSPAGDAEQAEAAWGRELAEASSEGQQPPALDAAHEQVVVRLVDDLGFAPAVLDVPSDVVWLRRCPMIELAREHPDVVCGVHRGLVRGALEQLGADPGPVTLKLFAEPGACLLHLPAAAPDRQRRKLK